MPTPIVRSGGTTSSSTSLTASAKAWAESFNFGSKTAVSRVDVARTKAPTTGPEALQRAYAFYKSWEDNDLGSVRLLKTTTPSGQPIFALHTTTDGDDGFLELYSEKGALLATGKTGFDASGRRNVSWDATPGAVRDHVAPKDASPSVEAFFHAIDGAGSVISGDELRAAAKSLVGPELTTASVDGFEKAGLLRVLAEERLSSTSRTYGEQLAQLYTPAANTTLSRFSTGTLGQTSSFTRSVKTASAQVNVSGAPPRLNTMTALSRRAFGEELPSQVVPISRTEALSLLREAGASATEARAAVDSLADAKGTLYAGRFFAQGADWIPKARGLALFGVTSSGRELKALNVGGTTAPTPSPIAEPRELIKKLLGVDRAVEITARRTTATGTAFELAWLPPTGGRIEGTLTVPSNGDEPTISGVRLPPASGPTETGLAQRVSTPASAREGLGYANSGSTWLLAHRAATGVGPIALSQIRIAIGGATESVTNKTIGTTAEELELARMLALGIARNHAAGMVADPSMPDAARLEVALRTRWAAFSDLEKVNPTDSAVGFNTTTDRVQFMLPRTWGDNAVFVTFEKNGGVRVEDFN